MASDGEDVPTLLARARGQLDELSYDDARGTLVRALELDPSHAASHELLGELFVDQGHRDHARISFEKAVELETAAAASASTADGAGEGEAGAETFAKYLWLAQLCDEGSESLRWYETGVERLSRHIPAVSSAQEAAALRARLASAYSAMAELYMTDLCMAPEAESRCEAYVTKALLADDEHAEALQTLASMRLSQQRNDEAQAALRRSLNLWLDPARDSQSDGPEKTPSYSTRLSLVRLLLECEMLDDAHRVLDGLEAEDDEQVELWYLSGWTYVLLGERVHSAGGPDAGPERHALWEDARDCLKKCEKLYRAQDYDDDALREHASDLLALVHGAGISLEPRPEPGPSIPGMPGQPKQADEEDAEPDDAEWESDDEDVEMTS